MLSIFTLLDSRSPENGSSALCLGPNALTQLFWMLSLRLGTFLCGQNIKSLHFQDLETAVLRRVIRFRGGPGEGQVKHLFNLQKVMKRTCNISSYLEAAGLCKLITSIHPDWQRVMVMILEHLVRRPWPLD